MKEYDNHSKAAFSSNQYIEFDINPIKIVSRSHIGIILSNCV